MDNEIIPPILRIVCDVGLDHIPTILLTNRQFNHITMKCCVQCTKQTIEQMRFCANMMVHFANHPGKHLLKENAKIAYLMKMINRSLLVP